MESTAVTTLVGRRLERLRTADGAGPRVGRSAPWQDPAESLARALGGEVRAGASGGVVQISESLAVPFEIRSLASLPYVVDVSRPLVCIDLETTGLATAAGTLAFLVGVGIWRNGIFEISQLLLPDHSAEATLLDVLEALVPPDGWLVTYNGKCFDWPLITARYRLHRRTPPTHAGHLDLLPVARALWKHRLGGARLSLVEAELCGVRRADDLPGALIPERYFGYLRSRRPGLLRAVVEHNRQDVISMIQLLAVIAGEVCSPASWPNSHPGDLFGLARAYARRGRPVEALPVVDAALKSRMWMEGVADGAQLRRRLSAERARLLARTGRRSEAYAAWSEIASRGGPGAGLAWLHVARYREHLLRDLRGALDACQEARAVADQARAWGAPLTHVESDLARRLPRLRGRLLRAGDLASGGVGRAA